LKHLEAVGVASMDALSIRPACASSWGVHRRHGHVAAHRPPPVARARAGANRGFGGLSRQAVVGTSVCAPQSPSCEDPIVVRGNTSNEQRA
jgi:hypothetical protein